MEIAALGFFLGLVALWIVFAGITIRRWIGYQWLLLFMAMTVMLVAGVPFDRTIFTLLGEGMTYNAVIAIQFVAACLFARSVQETGIVDALIKKTIELGAGKPFITVALATAVWAYVFLGIPGVAGVIIVGSITLPVMMTMGIDPSIAARIHIDGLIIGWPMAVAYWPGRARFSLIDPTAVPVLGPAIMTTLTAIVVYIWIAYRFKREGYKFWWTTPPQATPNMRKEAMTPEGKPRLTMAPAYSFVAPAIPVILLMVFKWPLITAFIVSILPALLLTQPGSGRKPRDYFGLLERITYEGFKDSAPIGINVMFVGMYAWMGLKVPEVITLFKNSIGTMIPYGEFGMPATILMTLLIPASVLRGPGLSGGLGALTLSAFSALKVGMQPYTLAGKTLEGSIPIWMYTTSADIMYATCPTFAYSVWAYGYVGRSPVTALTYRPTDALWNVGLGWLMFHLTTYLWRIGIIHF